MNLTNSQKDALKEYGFAILRRGLQLLGLILIRKGWISVEESSILTTQSVVEIVGSLLAVGAVEVWVFAKVRFNVFSRRVARSSPEGTTMTAITEKTIENHNVISSI